MCPGGVLYAVKNFIVMVELNRGLKGLIITNS